MDIRHACSPSTLPSSYSPLLVSACVCMCVPLCRRWGDDADCGAVGHCYEGSDYIGPLVPTEIFTLFGWSLLCYVYRKNDALPSAIANHAKRTKWVAHLGGDPAARSHKCCCCGSRSIGFNTWSILVLTFLTLLLALVLHTIGVASLYSGMWLGAAVLYITCMAWLRNASKSWKTPPRVRNLMSLGLALAIISGLLSTFAGAYGATIRALCNAPGSTCDPSFVSSSKQGVYTTLYVAFWLIWLQMLLLPYCAAQIYLPSRTAQEIWPAESDSCEGTPAAPRRNEDDNQGRRVEEGKQAEEENQGKRVGEIEAAQAGTAA